MEQVKHSNNADYDEQRKVTEVSNFLPDALRRGKSATELSWRDTLPQMIASCIAYFIVIQAGANMSYSTVLIDELQRVKENNVRITTNQASWITSLVTISLPIGSLLSGPLVDKFGRKTVCIITCLPSIISWIILTITTNIHLIYTARAIAGIAAGLSTASVIYVIEITHPKIRAMVLAMNSVFVSLGILLICIFALFLNSMKIAMVFIALNAAFMCLLFVIPESPYWLICIKYKKSTKSNQESIEIAAIKAIKWLNPRESVCEAELTRIKQTTSSTNSQTTLMSYIEAVKTPVVYKPMILLFFIFLVQQLSGAYVVIFYAISVFKELGGSLGRGLDEYWALVLLGIIRFIMSIVTAIMSRKIGRRVLCIASGLGMSFSMFFSAMFIYLTTFCGDGGIDKAVAEQKWMLLIIVLFYVCMSSLGFIVIPWTLIGELLPISFRGVGGGLMVSIAYILMFGVIKTYPHALNLLGAQNIFFIFSAVSLIGTSIVYLLVPETLGKNFTEIEAYFGGRKTGGGRRRMKNSVGIL